jgi:hypothetical protein
LQQQHFPHVGLHWLEHVKSVPVGLLQPPQLHGPQEGLAGVAQPLRQLSVLLGLGAEPVQQLVQHELHPLAAP